MGLPRAAIHLLLQETSQRPFSGKIATLGRQHVYAKLEEIQRMAVGKHATLCDSEVTLHRDSMLADRDFISDDSLFQLLGFDESVRIDFSNYEDVDELLDLNQSETPAHLLNAFDVVLDSGTIEHVFDIPAALRHCCRMVKPGGRIIHITPASNSVDHGFYSISPTLFADFYSSNGLQLEAMLFCRLPRRFERQTWNVYDYLKRSRFSLPFGRLDGKVYFTFVVVTSSSESTEHVVPQQSFYLSTWDSTAENAIQDVFVAGTFREPVNSKAARLLQLTSGNRFFYGLSQLSIRIWRGLINQFRDRRQGKVPYPKVGQF